jgi:phenylacetate-CoA ligase
MIREMRELISVHRVGRLSAGQLRELRITKLRAILNHAFQNVPYYRSLFHIAGLSPGDVRDVGDLQHLPITTKADLKRAGLASIIDQRVDLASRKSWRTSGTTGDQFDLYGSNGELSIRAMVTFRAYRALGFGPWDRLCHLGPRLPRLNWWLGPYRSKNMSALLPLEEQIKQLRSEQPTILRVWPTVFRVLLHQVDYRLSDIARPRALITSAEVFDPSLRRRVEADLPDIEIFSFWAAMEFGEIACECPAHEGLHVQADQVILETVRDDGQPAAAGEAGTAVITALSNYTMPLIRYRLGDVCTMVDRPCSCGSVFPLISAPQGRHEDVVRLPSGQLRSALGLGTVVDGFDEVDQYRFIQESRDHLVVKLVLFNEAGQGALAQFRAGLMDYLGEPMRLDIHIVDSIPEDRYKFRKFISKVPDTGL